MLVGKDEWTPALKALAKNATPGARVRILTKIGLEQVRRIKNGIGNELQYDGLPMRSPSKRPRGDGKFAESYKWRYRPGYRHLDSEEAKVLAASGGTKVGRRRLSWGQSFSHGKLNLVIKIRRRIPVGPSARQLNDTGGTKKSIDILSVDCNRVTVGPNTGHGNLIISVHNPKRRPFGISKEMADWAQKTAADDLLT